jgi:hypothetical protein
MKLSSISDVEIFEPECPDAAPVASVGKRRSEIRVASIGREINSTMECSGVFYQAMVAFCRQHVKGKMNVFWLDKAKPG